MWNRTQFIDIINQLALADTKTIDFCGGGEPTINPHLADMIHEWVANNEGYCGLITNGSMMTGRLRGETLEHASWLRFSIEAGNKEVFNHYKRPKTKLAGWENVITNLWETVQERNESGSKCLIGYKYTVGQNNTESIYDAFKLADSIEVDSLQFKLIRNTPDELGQQDALGLRNHVNTLIKRYPHLKVFNGIQPLPRLEGSCWLNPLWPTIDTDGNVYVCCYYRHRMPQHCIGNMFESSLQDVWYSEKHWSKMRGIDKSDCVKYDCRFMKYNDFMTEVYEDDRGQVQFL